MEENEKIILILTAMILLIGIFIYFKYPKKNLRDDKNIIIQEVKDEIENETITENTIDNNDNAKDNNTNIYSSNKNDMESNNVGNTNVVEEKQDESNITKEVTTTKVDE